MKKQKPQIKNTEIQIAPAQSLIPEGNPEAQVAYAAKAAEALMQVLAKKTKQVIINGQKYLEYEDYQTIAKFFGLTVETGEAEPVDVNGIKGAKAKATVYNREGVKIGGAEAYCLYDEPNWKDKPWFQLASMAQTRAGSKSLRNQLAWVAVLAGFAGTPAEEMTVNVNQEYTNKITIVARENRRTKMGKDYIRITLKDGRAINDFKGYAKDLADNKEIDLEKNGWEVVSELGFWNFREVKEKEIPIVGEDEPPFYEDFPGPTDEDLKKAGL